VFGECFTMHGKRMVSFEWTVRLRDGDKINELSSLVLYSSLIAKHQFGFTNSNKITETIKKKVRLNDK